MGRLRKLFGPNRDEVWQRLCEEIEAEVVDGGFWKGKAVKARVGEWTLVLDTYQVHAGNAPMFFTRMRAPYVNADGFRFTVYREGFFSGWAKVFGMQDVIVGHRQFDREYIIKGTDEAKLQALFANKRIRELIRAQPGIRLEVVGGEGWFGSSYPESVDALCSTLGGIVTDLEQLKGLFDLHAEVLNQLCHIGSAYEDDPEVDL
ncbi:MAG: DUF3137 domain-containing protein [Planctomycetota bacterium]|jgi:hypothetical protein